MKTFIAFGVLALTLIALPALAADRDGMYIAFGRGLQTCASQRTAYGLTNEAINWIAGFMSSFNIYQPDTFDITGLETGWHHWITEYCTLNPTLSLTDAATAFINTSYNSRLVQQVPTITPPVRQPRSNQSRVTKAPNRY